MSRSTTRRLDAEKAVIALHFGGSPGAYRPRLRRSRASSGSRGGHRRRASAVADPGAPRVGGPASRESVVLRHLRRRGAARQVVPAAPWLGGRTAASRSARRRRPRVHSQERPASDASDDAGIFKVKAARTDALSPSFAALKLTSPIVTALVSLARERVPELAAPREKSAQAPARSAGATSCPRSRSSR